MRERYAPVFWGIFLGLLTLIFAESQASTFGIYEKDIKNLLLHEALEHTEGVVIKGHEDEGDHSKKVFKNRAEAKKTASKAWVYLKRAHSHGEGMGAIAIVLCLVIANSRLKRIVKKLFSVMIGLGALGYPLSWLYAGTFMVDIGKAAAKADVHLLAVTSVGLYMGALFALAFLLLLSQLKPDMALARLFFEEKAK